MPFISYKVILFYSFSLCLHLLHVYLFSVTRVTSPCQANIPFFSKCMPMEFIHSNRTFYDSILISFCRHDNLHSIAHHININIEQHMLCSLQFQHTTKEGETLFQVKKLRDNDCTVTFPFSKLFFDVSRPSKVQYI